MKNNFKALNTVESKDKIVRRLLLEAKGKKQGVSIVEALEFRREQYGLTCGDFAKVLGIHNTHYSEFRNGKRALPIIATKRAFAIGVPPQFLLQQ